MHPLDLDPYDVTIHLVGGDSVTTLIEIESMDELRDRIKRDCGRYPGWIIIGDVLVYSQNIVAIQPVYDEEAE